MLTFKEYLLESTAGNYVSIALETPIIMPSLEKIFGKSLICDAKNQHVTLMYSVSTDLPEDKIKSVLSSYGDSFEVTTDNVAAFDSPDKNKNTCAIVVKLKSKLLDEIHTGLSKLGLKHSYDEFIPHVSLLYGVPIEDKERAIKAVEAELSKSKVITLKTYKIEQVNTEWTDRLKK